MIGHQLQRTDTARAAQPDAPGLWRFTGTVTTRRGEAQEMSLILDDWLLKIIEDRDELLITDPESGMQFGGEWVGTWVQQRVG